VVFAFWKNLFELEAFLFIQPGDKHRLILGKHSPGDSLDLGDRFAGSVNDFRSTKSAHAVQIHLGESLRQVR
jgi:hypothetical protein